MKFVKNFLVSALSIMEGLGSGDIVHAPIALEHVAINLQLEKSGFSGAYILNISQGIRNTNFCHF